MAWKEEQPACPVADDQVSLGSYHSDAYTLPCDPLETGSRSEVSHDSYDSHCRDEALPSYRVPVEQGVSQSVYEAWIIYYSDSQDAIQRTTFCGLPVCTRYAESSPYVSCITEPYAQDDLSAMTQTAFHGYQSAHKRSFPSRILRSRPRTYEADLDARIQKLPRAVQSELDGLLGDREAATGNRFHKRDWTVAMMREQYRYRFATAEYEEVKKSGKHFWKKGSANRPSEYFFIIRGGEGRVAVDDKGMHTATRHGNPWKRVDDLERIRKQSARDIPRYGKDYERVRVRSSERSPSPPPCRVRLESEGPASPTPCFPNPFTPSTQFAMPPSFPPSGPFDHMRLSRPWHASQAMPRTCPYIGSMGRHPPLPQHPSPPPPMMPSPYSTAGVPCLPHAPPLMPMAPPPLTASFPRHPQPPPPPPAGPKFSLQPFNMNPPANNEPLFDFDFDTFLRDHVAASLTSPGSPRASPPPAPRLSNLTTPTTFSRASSAPDTESNVEGTEVSTPVERASLEFRVGEEGASGGNPFIDYMSFQNENDS